VVDIGGGSTELVAGPADDGGPTAVRSMDVGCVRLTERFLRSDPPDSGEVSAAAGEVRGLLRRATDQTPALNHAAQLVGLAGTVACLAAVDQGLDGYDRARQHHYILRRDRVEAMLERLMRIDSAGRRLIPGVEEARADVIVGGTVVLVEIMRHFGYDECLTSEADILDGLVLSTRAE
jgi:exopolyphosphatase / guanosine-5'-triphosphate,3'-diphosphate pyrophosphatase